MPVPTDRAAIRLEPSLTSGQHRCFQRVALRTIAALTRAHMVSLGSSWFLHRRALAVNRSAQSISSTARSFLSSVERRLLRGGAPDHIG